jgi:hypothetical protein
MQPDPGGHADLHKRISRRMDAAGIRAQVSAALEKAFEAALTDEPVVVSRPERKRLFRQVARDILQEVAAALDDS